MAERTDILKNGFKIVQDSSAFCFGIDAVLLADFVKLKNSKKGQQIFDLGCGNGILPLLLQGKIKRTENQKNLTNFTGIEIQEQAVRLAQKSVTLNHLEDCIKIIHKDIKNITKDFKAQSADIVISNPPYMTVEQSSKNSTDEKTIARHEVFCNLEQIVQGATWLLKPNGSFYMIHRPYRLSEIFSAMEKYRLTPRRLKIIYPKINMSPEMVLIEGRPNYKPDLKIEPPLIMYDEKNQYTSAMAEILDRQ